MDITCGRLTIQDIIACSLDLKKSEYKLFEILLREKEPLTIIDLSKKLSLDRTTVQKILKVFSHKGLVQRYQLNLENGGYVFRYAVKDKQSIKKHLKTMLKNWYETSSNTIEQW